MYSFEMEYDIAKKRYREMRAKEKESGMLDDPDEEEFEDPNSQASLHKHGYNLLKQMDEYRRRCDKLTSQINTATSETEKKKFRRDWDRARMEVALRAEKMWWTYNKYFSRSVWAEEERIRPSLGLKPLSR